MSDDKVLDDVQAWLDQHGYVLEMEVARALIRHCGYVRQGEQYVDPVTSKLRETDVLCSWSGEEADPGISHVLEFVIECKNTTAPWVAFFGGSVGAEEALPLYSIEGERKDCGRCEEVVETLLNLGPGANARSAYAITEKRSDKSARDHAREAALAVTSASIAIMGNSISNYGKANSIHYSYHTLPLVVTNSPIVACSLDNSGVVRLSRIDHCWLSVPHEKWNYPIMVLIQTYVGLDSLLADVSAGIKQLGFR